MQSQRALHCLFVACLTGVAMTGVTAGAERALHSPALVVGWVEIRPAAQGKDQVTIIGHAYGLTQTEGKFAFSVRRSSMGGAAKTGQSGTFNVAAGQDAVLSRTTVDVSPTTSLVIELKLFVDGREAFSVIMKPAAASGAREL